MSLVGKNIDDFCSRCQLILAHVVLYEVGGSVQGVQCKTCGSQHRYRGPRTGRQRDVAEERRRTRQAPRPPRPIRPVNGRLWEQRNAAAADAVVWEYQPTERFEKGDVINHALFGRGFVEAVTADRMEVLFREGRKTLAMNRPAPVPPD